MISARFFKNAFSSLSNCSYGARFPVCLVRPFYGTIPPTAVHWRRASTNLSLLLVASVITVAHLSSDHCTYTLVHTYRVSYLQRPTPSILVDPQNGKRKSLTTSRTRLSQRCFSIMEPPLKKLSNIILRRGLVYLTWCDILEPRTSVTGNKSYSFCHVRRFWLNSLTGKIVMVPVWNGTGSFSVYNKKYSNISPALSCEYCNLISHFLKYSL